MGSCLSGRKINLIRNDDLSFFKKRNASARRESGMAKGKIGTELCPPSESELLEEKKATGGETGKAYQTGFQITEVIPFVIDSPIATYRISVGSSWEGNYKGERERRVAWEMERKKARCVWGRTE